MSDPLGLTRGFSKTWQSELVSGATGETGSNNRGQHIPIMQAGSKYPSHIGLKEPDRRGVEEFNRLSYDATGESARTRQSWGTGYVSLGWDSKYRYNFLAIASRVSLPSPFSATALHWQSRPPLHVVIGHSPKHIMLSLGKKTRRVLLVFLLIVMLDARLMPFFLATIA
jgi:hypothetical protein